MTTSPTPPDDGDLGTKLTATRIGVYATVAECPMDSVANMSRGLEDAGCEAISFAEITHDPFVLAALACPSTTRASVGTGIALAFTRSPTTLAYVSHDLQEASGGRFVLGLGAQVRAHVERRFSSSWQHPVGRMRELIAAMRAVWACWESGDPLQFDGSMYRLSLMPELFRPGRFRWGPPPVYLAAVGPRMVTLAGEIADGIFLHPLISPHYFESVVLPALRAGLETTGRSLDDVEICCPPYVASALTPKGLSQKRERMRGTVAFYASTTAYRGVLDAHGWGDLQPRLNDLARQGAWDRMGPLVSDEVLNTFAVIGSPDEVAEQLVARWGGLIGHIGVGLDAGDLKTTRTLVHALVAAIDRRGVDRATANRRGRAI